jgi:run domain Beclin-1 interacting cysteine-rich containing protein
MIYVSKCFTGLSVSMASLYSEADLSKHPLPRTGTDVALTETVMSAEGVALSLLRRFSEKHLPRASDLEWLVSEQDAPQQVLLHLLIS